MSKIKGELLLLIAAAIWGSAYIFQKMGMDFVGPICFTAFRFGIGAAVMIPVVLVSDEIKKKKGKRISSYKDKNLIKGGIFVGISNLAASLLQQAGLIYTTAGKAAFLTSTSVVIVPVFLVLLKRKVHFLTWTGSIIACAGVYLLSVSGHSQINTGDILCVLCASCYVIQILLIDSYVEKVDPLKLAMYEFAITAIVSFPLAFIFEGIDMGQVFACIEPILYTAVIEVAFGFTLQMIGQQYAPPAIATLIMSSECVFAVICGCLFLNEVMSVREISGCVIMFAAFIVAQIPEMRESL